MKIRIYQINMERDKKAVCFECYEYLKRTQKSPVIESGIYDMVYEADVDCNDLEDVYKLLNVDHPEDYTARSLSVSDIVEVVDYAAVPPGFYYCDSVGFKAVEFEPALAARTAV